MSSAALATLASITRDAITNCPDVEPFMGDVRLLGDVHLNETADHQIFWASFFEPDPAERARFQRVMRAPAQALADLATLHRAVHGTLPPPQRALLELLRRRVALAYFPSADIVVRRALDRSPGAAGYAAHCLTKHIERSEWLRKS